MADDAQRIADCRELYIKYGGRHHELIEREMRGLGHTRFRRRIMYTRRERGRVLPGWIDRFGWKESLQSSRVPDLQSFQEAHLPNSATLQLPNSVNSPSDDFHAWLKTQPGMWNWDWRHQRYIYKYLKRVTDGSCKRLMIFLPPRHGKSELVTVRYSAWRLSRDPSLNVILGSCTQRLANRFSRKIRHVLCDDSSLTAETQRRGEDEARGRMMTMPKVAATSDGNPDSPKIFSQRLSDSAVNIPASPFPFVRQRPANSVAEWETTEGGGLRAVGVGGGVTGFGASLIVIDDPVKSRAEAESPKIREKVWDWFNDDIYTRLEPNGAIILIQTRWHEDDLAGRLLREMENGGEQWEVISLPALAESQITNDQLRITNSEENAEVLGPDIRNSPFVIRNLHTDEVGRAPGEALCPERFDEPALANLQRKLGTYSFSALYQQRPTPAEGMIFKRDWFKTIVKQPPPDLKWTRGYDLAVSTKTTADYTASFRVAYDGDGNLYIDGGFRKRVEFPDQRRYILGRIHQEQDTEHGIELALHGQGIMQDLRRSARLQGRRFRGIPVTGDKLTRALKWSSLAEEGRVILVRGGWNADFIDEACAFPGGQFDDQIDAVSIAVRMHEKQAGRLIRF